MVTICSHIVGFSLGNLIVLILVGESFYTTYLTEIKSK